MSLASMVVSSNPLLPAPAPQSVPAGTPLRDLAPPALGPLMLRVNGLWLLRADWWRPALPGDVIEWHQVPMGGGDGNNTSRQVLTLIAVIVISYFTAGAGASLIGLEAGSATALAVGAVATVAATAIINALVPIQAPALGTQQSPGSVYNVTTAANQARLAQPIPVIYGRMLTFPDYAGQPYSEYDGNNDQYFYAVYCVAQGSYVKERLQIDDTSLDHYSDVSYEVLPPGSLPTIALANVVSASEVVGQTMLSGRPIGGFSACGPTLAAKAIGIDVAFPGGLGLADNSGNIGNLSATFRTDARYIDDFGVAAGDWFALGTETVTRATSTPQRLSFKYTLGTPGRVEVRIVRTDTKNASNNALHTVVWGALRAYLNATATLCPTATHLAIRIRASEQLSGLSSRKVSGIWRRKLRTWSSGGGWGPEIETRNPMWARLDKLSNAVYGDGLPDARIDLQTHADLASICDARQDRFDILFDSKVTSLEADRTICQSARSVPFQRAGVCTLTRDQLQTLPVTAFTSRDMAPGSMSIGYALATEIVADGVVLEYFDNRAWDWREILCPAPGVSVPTNAVRQRLLGISGRKHANREGLYMAAQNVYRRKFPKFTTEMQGLLPAYGSAVMFAPALPGWGQAGDVAFWDAGTLVMGVTEPVQFSGSGTTVPKTVLASIGASFTLGRPGCDIRLVGSRLASLRVVSNANQGAVDTFNPGTGAVLGGYGINEQTTQLADDGSFLFVSAINGTNPSHVFRFDPASLTAPTHTYLGTATADCQGVAFDGTSVWVSEFYTNRIRKLNPTDLSVVASYSLSSPRRMVYSVGSLWICTASGVVQVSTSTGAVLQSLAGTSQYADVAVVGGIVFCWCDSAVKSFDAGSGALIASVAITSAVPLAARLTVFGGYVVAADIGSGELVFMDGATGLFTRRISVGSVISASGVNGTTMFATLSSYVTNAYAGNFSTVQVPGPGAVQHYISIRRDDGSVTSAIAVTPGPTEYDLQLASAPMLADGTTPMPMILDDANRERPKYVFGKSGQHRIMVRLLGISKKGRGSDGAPMIEISAVAEDVRVHQVDNALLPGPGEIQDPVDGGGTGGATNFTTTINLDSRLSDGMGARGIRLDGMSSDWVLRLDMPAGGTYTGWSPWSSDYASEVPSAPTAWGNAFSINNPDGSVASFGSNAIATSGEAARAAFSPVTITGYTSYVFWISDTNSGDNRGGLSIRVTKI